MSLNVYGAGNALVDVQARVPDAFLEAVGYEKGVMTLVSDAAQAAVLGELARFGDIQTSRCAGGSAANTILGVAQLGGTAAYAGKVAGDGMGEFFAKDLAEAGVKLLCEASPEGQTGTCAVLITEDAERTMLTNLAVSATLSADNLRAEDAAGADWAYVEGYLFGTEPNASAARAVIKHAKAAGARVALTVSDPFLVAGHRLDFLELIGGPVDLLFCNLEEARGLTGKEDPRECAAELSSMCERVALTMGAEGSLLAEPLETVHVAGVPVQAVDTTGAGDMYAAGILYGLTNGLSFEEAGRVASLAASRVVAQMGARLADPIPRADIDAAIAG